MCFSNPLDFLRLGYYDGFMYDLIRHLFLPHVSNNHRARLLQLDALIVYIFMLSFLQIAVKFTHRQVPQVLGYATDIYAEQLLGSTNQKRIEAGLTPLSMNDQLSQAAVSKAQDMFANNYWAHTSPNGKTPWDFITGSGYEYSVAGENLAKNFYSSQSVVDAWMASPTHKDNLLKSNYSDVGFAIVNGILNGEETTLVVQMFGSKSARRMAMSPPKVEAAPPAPDVQPPEPVEAEPVKTEIPNPVPGSESPSDPVVKEKPVVIPESAVTHTSLAQFQSIHISPFIDQNRVTKSISVFFLVSLLAVFALDLYFVYKNKLYRVTGHSSAHILFFLAILLAISLSIRGSIL